MDAHSNSNSNLGVSVYHLKTVLLEEVVLENAKKSQKHSKLFLPTAWVPCNKDHTLTRDSTIYELEKSDRINQQTEIPRCPRDGQPGAAYVDSIRGEEHVGKATHVLCYSWAYSIGDIVDTLWTYCCDDNHRLDSKRTYIWMDFLCKKTFVCVHSSSPD